jgi:N6-L-threonylcarbamoyladenine synthase
LIILGIESSCDECSVALVEDGRRIISQVVATQIELHRPYDGVVPELASRKHLEWIGSVYRQALHESGSGIERVDAIAVTNRPGLAGSLQIGLSFAKGLAWTRSLPLVGVDHILGHLYAPQLERAIEYPFLGLLVSGGHSIICRMDAPDELTVLGASIDDAVGEAFDKVAKHYGLGYPGGKAIDDLARRGDPQAFNFPHPNLYKGNHPYDVSYSGLKNAVVNQLSQFRRDGASDTIENIAASFERVAVDILVRRVVKAARDQKLTRIVAGGGVAANSYLRQSLAAERGLQAFFPSLALCADNAAMIAGIGHWLVVKGVRSGLDENVSPRVAGFRKAYP